MKRTLNGILCCKDGTLIITKSGRIFPKDGNDWRWWNPMIPRHLEQLHEKGYKIVIFSNQNGLKSGERSKMFQHKIETMLSEIKAPVWVLAALDKDKHRKPRTGMWTFLERESGNTCHGRIDRSNSFFVGDAAGREQHWKPNAFKDHSCVDRKFADNLNITFYTPEEYFLKEPKAPFTWGSFDPRHKDVQNLSCETHLVFPEAAGTEVLVCVGAPDSGRLAFATEHLEPKNYAIVNQTLLKSHQKCISQTKKALEAGQSVVIVNTNPGQTQRAPYIQAAKEAGVPIRCLYFYVDEETLQHNASYRRFHPHHEESGKEIPVVVHRNYRSHFVEPTVEEGFNEVHAIPFLFQGSEEDLCMWRQWYM
ncbi:polynucleotide kinase 3 phosphatase-domain-containing protein [Spinellus fusiger]|nr:polynucleotide kinase 3 phosphatase-domain-containing protein [Spinellus fusiger]